MLIPMIGKFICSHHVTRYVCQEHQRCPFRGLWVPPRAPGRPSNCECVHFLGFLAYYNCYISNSILFIEKLIGPHLIMRLVCQRPPRYLKGGLRATKSLETACKFYICQFSTILDMLYIKFNPFDRETHCTTSYHKISMSGSPHIP